MCDLEVNLAAVTGTACCSADAGFADEIEPLRRLADEGVFDSRRLRVTPKGRPCAARHSLAVSN